MPSLGDPKVPQPLGACDALGSRYIPVDGCATLKLQQIAGLELDEEEGRPRLTEQIPERVEITVAAKVRNRERVVIDPYESGAAASMRDVSAAVRSDSARERLATKNVS